MQEVKRPKKPLIYYVTMILAILIFNCLVAHILLGKPLRMWITVPS